MIFLFQQHSNVTNAESFFGDKAPQLLMVDNMRILANQEVPVDHCMECMALDRHSVHEHGEN